jgi:hypothetical protein
MSQSVPHLTRPLRLTGAERSLRCPLDPILEIIHGAAEPFLDLADIRLIEDQRRAQRYGIAERADDESVRLRALAEIYAGPFGRIERRLGRLVADELEGADEADAAHLADMGPVGEALERRLERVRHPDGPSRYSHGRRCRSCCSA